MTKSLVLAAAALALSSVIASAQNAPANVSAKSKQAAHHEKSMSAKPLYDYAPSHLSAYGNTPIILGVTY